MDKGSAVKRGQVLGIVDNADLRFAVDQAKAELKRKLALADDAGSPVLSELRAKLQASDEQLQIALDNERRVTALMGHGGTSQNDLDQSMNRVKSLWSDAESYKSQIAAKKLDLERDAEVARAALASANGNWIRRRSIARSMGRFWTGRFPMAPAWQSTITFYSWRMFRRVIW